MCGVCGLYGVDSDDELQRSLSRMQRSIAHRGPDAEGTFLDAGIGLGHQRLSILDLSPTGAQPMSLGGTTVVHNGECYNFRDLRRELEQEGRRFEGSSDTEVLLHAYAAWGLRGLSRLDGMFAFALWDATRRRLVLMRDRFGIKPLFYAWQGNQLAFGSEVKAVLAGLNVDRSIDDQALSEYLWYGNAYEDRTLFRSVRALPPGHQLIVEQGKTQLRPWWKIEEWLPERQERLDPQEAAAGVRLAIDRAVRRQLVSDVPVGIFLSGGLDSSSIAASAALASEAKLASYAVGFDFAAGVDELPKARLVADEFGLDHHELHVSGGSLDEVLVELVRAHDEPFADAANIPLFLLAKQLGGAIKVVLQGDGGDEMFAGYRRYALLQSAGLWSWWPQSLSKLLRATPHAVGARLARLGFAASLEDPSLRMALLLTMETLWDPPTAVLREAARSKLESESDPFLAYRRCAQRFSSADAVQKMLLTDVSLQLPCQFLPKVDRATMAHGIESRVPLLDEQVGAFAVALPSGAKVHRGKKKFVLREAMRGRLPDGIIDGPKTGFGVPYAEWLKRPLYDFTRANVLDKRFVERFGIDQRRVEQALQDHRSSRRDRGFLLWKLLQLSLWSREYLA